MEFRFNRWLLACWTVRAYCHQHEYPCSFPRYRPSQAIYPFTDSQLIHKHHYLPAFYSIVFTPFAIGWGFKKFEIRFIYIGATWCQIKRNMDAVPLKKTRPRFFPETLESSICNGCSANRSISHISMVTSSYCKYSYRYHTTWVNLCWLGWSWCSATNPRGFFFNPNNKKQTTFSSSKWWSEWSVCSSLSCFM